MWTCVGSSRRWDSRRCWAVVGCATIAPGCAAVEASALTGLVVGTGVGAVTSTGGGATVLVVAPTTPVSTATSAASPSAASVHAISHAPRSDGGTGVEACGAAGTAAHANRAPRRSWAHRVITDMRMSRLRIATLTAAACLAAGTWASLTGTSAAASSPSAAPAPQVSAQLTAGVAPRATLSAVQENYLALAQAGVAAAERRWRNGRLGWYDERLGDRERYPLATIWGVVPLFESLDAIAIAAPTAANLHALTAFAAGAERYLNRGLRPVAGYSPYPGDREPDTETWFDDNGWWGVAFVEAYRATGARRYLRDAERALRYVAAAGWDPSSGGIWWDTDHPFKSGPALAADTLLATLLYQQTRSSFALAQAHEFLAWANTAGFSAANGLYTDTSVSSTPVDYVEGPLIYAQAALCRLTGAQDECARAEALKQTALSRFGFLLDFSPQYDAIYLQWMLALYALDDDPTLYYLAADNARDAQTRAANAEGLYLLSWNGETLPAFDAAPGMLQTQAATTSVFAWLAVYQPPGS